MSGTMPRYPNVELPEFEFTQVEDLPKIEAAINACDAWITYNSERCQADQVGFPESDMRHFEILQFVLQRLKLYEDKYGKL